MDMHTAFLTDIAANVEDDAPRLVYADWLEENGDPERAAFIRGQCRLPKMGPCDPERFALQIEAEALLEKFGKQFPKPLAKITKNVEFRRGFPYRVVLQVEKFVAHHEALLAAGPTLREYRPLRNAVGWDKFLRCPALGRLTSLDIGFGKLGVERTVALAASPLIAGLASLNVSGSAMRRRGAAALADSSHLPKLRRLDLRGNDIRDEGVQALAASTTLPNLISLDISDNGMGPAGIAALGRSPLAARLQELAVKEEKGDDGLARAFAGGDWSSLRKLSLSLPEISAEGLTALAACPSLSGLRELEADFSPERSWRSWRLTNIAALFASPRFASLERLHLASSVGNGSLRALADSPLLAGLRGLRAVREDEGMAAVLRSPHSAGLVEWDYFDEGDSLRLVAQAFAEVDHLTNLRKVVFGHGSREAPWVADFLNSPNLAAVVGLDFAVSEIDRKGLQALVASPHLKSLRRLRLNYDAFSNHPDLRPAVEERFGPGVLTVR
jgi:uncharacterized protein (TIGR02996 family)